MSLSASSAFAPDRSGYHTHVHPEDFVIDWPAYYEAFDRRTAELQKSAHHERNVPFGASRYERLDIYYPAELEGGHPVLYFMHGGGHREGHPYHYGFIAKPFIERGVIFVSAGYRLVPDEYYPDNVASAAAGLAWIHHNIAARGGDPASLYVGGHSAGALISANLSLRKRWQEAAGLPAGVINGAVLLSGIFDLRGYPAKQVRDGTDLGAVSPVTFAEQAPPHTVIAFGWPVEPNRADNDNRAYGLTGHAFADVLRGLGGSVEVLALDGYDHAQVAAALGDPDDAVFQAAAGMIARRQPQPQR